MIYILLYYIYLNFYLICNFKFVGYPKSMGGMSNWMGAMMGNPFMNLAQGSSNMMFPQNMPYPGMMPPNINQAQFLQGILIFF